MSLSREIRVYYRLGHPPTIINLQDFEMNNVFRKLEGTYDKLHRGQLGERLRLFLKYSTDVLIETELISLNEIGLGFHKFFQYVREGKINWQFPVKLYWQIRDIKLAFPTETKDILSVTLESIDESLRDSDLGVLTKGRLGEVQADYAQYFVKYPGPKGKLEVLETMFEKANFHLWLRTAPEEEYSIHVKPSHSSYSTLKLTHVLHSFENIKALIPADFATLSDAKIVDALTSIEDSQFKEHVSELIIALNQSEFADIRECLVLVFRYLLFIRESFGPSGVDRNAAERRCIIDPVVFAAITLLKGYLQAEVEVWGKDGFPLNALGHGPLDYLLKCLSRLVFTSTSKTKKRSFEEVGDEDVQDAIDVESTLESSSAAVAAADTEGNDATAASPHASASAKRLSVEAKNKASFVKGVGQAIAQTADLLLDGTLGGKSYTPDQIAPTCYQSNTGVLSSGQRYFFFKVSAGGNENKERYLRPLGLFRFRFFPPNDSNKLVERDSNVSGHDIVKFDEFVTVVCALIVAMTDGKDGNSRLTMMKKGAAQGLVNMCVENCGGVVVA
jgi:hypothetical protein